jgi:hypothetical protein
MKDIVNKKIRRNLGYWELFYKWGEYRYGNGKRSGYKYVNLDGNGNGYGLVYGFGDGYGYGFVGKSGNGGSRTK